MTKDVFFKVKFTHNNSGLMWIRYKCTLLAKNFARNLFCADGMIKEIWAMDQTLSRHYSSAPSWMLAPKHQQEQSVHLSNTLQREREREAGRGRATVQKDLWINALRRELDLSSLEHLVWTASRKCKGSCALALCTKCHFSRTRTKRTQTAQQFVGITHFAHVFPSILWGSCFRFV